MRAKRDKPHHISSNTLMLDPRHPRFGDSMSSLGSGVKRETRGPDFRSRDPRDRDPRDRDPRDRQSARDRYLGYDPRQSGRGRGGYQRGGRDNRFRDSGPRDSYRGNYRERPSNGRGRDRRPFERKEANLSKKDIIKEFEPIFKALEGVPTIDKLPLEGSQWGVKPKGFEDVTAQRAKLSGLFPLPGRSSGLEDKEESPHVAAVLQQESKIDPVDSRTARFVIVRGVDYENVDYKKVADFFNVFLKSADAEGTNLATNYKNAFLAPNKKALIIEFNTSQAATLAMSFDSQLVQLSISDANSIEVKLEVARPGEYAVQCLPPYKSEDKDVQEVVVDSPRKLTLHVDKTVTDSQLQDELTLLCPLRAFKLLREVGTKESLGLAFVEFFIDPKEHPNLKAALKKIIDLVPKVKELSSVKDARFSCIDVSETGLVKTSIQDCPIDFRTLKALARNEYVAIHPKLKVIQIINAVTAMDLVDDRNARFIEDDIRQEAETFGTVVSVKIPRPQVSNNMPGHQLLKQTGLGKVYVEFEDENKALSAIMGLAGRYYNDRVVICAFYNHEDYLLGLV